MKCSNCLYNGSCTLQALARDIIGCEGHIKENLSKKNEKNKYQLVIEDSTNAYILDKEENTIVALCNTKRPDLEFNKLKDLIEKANRNWRR